MIIFNGKELTDIAPVKIDEIDVSPIVRNPVVRERPINAGAEFIRMTNGTRTVTITFALLESDRATREEHLQAIREWATTTAEKTIILPDHEGRHLEGIFTQLPDASFRKWWESKLKLVFTCFNNPYWTSDDVIEVPCGTAFSVGGSAAPLMTITRNGGKLTNQAYSDGSKAMTFSQIPAGNLVIDLNRQTAAIGSASIMQYYLPSSKWITPAVGANKKITGAGTIKFRERWV